MFANFRVASCNCCHDPFIVRSAQTCPPFIGFTQLAQPSRCSRSTLTTVCFCARVSVITSGLCVSIGSLCSYRVCSPSPDPSSARHLHLVVECGIHGQKPILQTSKVVVVLSFLYPKVPRVNVFRSLSCSQSIRHRIRHRTVTLYFNLHWDSQILIHRSQG